jgi:hypothetical protein
MYFQKSILPKENSVFRKEISITDEFMFISFFKMMKNIGLRLLSVNKK